MSVASFRILPILHSQSPHHSMLYSYTLLAPVTFSHLKFYRKELKKKCACWSLWLCDSSDANYTDWRRKPYAWITNHRGTPHFVPGCFPSSNLCVNKPALMGTKLRPVECHANASGWCEYWILAWNILIHTQPPANQCHGPAEILTHQCADILKIHNSFQQKYCTFTLSGKFKHFVYRLFDRLVIVERTIFRVLF